MNTRDAAVSAVNTPIIQMAFVVPDIREAIDTWVKDLGAGPWFLVDGITGDEPDYRGQPTEAAYALATTFVGDMQIELVEMKDDHPSAFREWVDHRGYGLHHLGVGSEDVEGDIRKYQAKGYETVFRCGSPLDGRIAFLSAGFDKPSMIEIIPLSEGTKEMRGMSRKASADWDGMEPIRNLF
ncbi:VOC family protein [Henriciella aquimarina]|uniref:VOC family protein n=1 Tax=Henriciella aquimarina TaxID=545261 RepID=UPI001301CA2D|nr:VOC family protein [Henriciella aquimarina]